MRAWVEWSSISRHYYVRLGTRRADPARHFDVAGAWSATGGYEWTTRKAEAERAARKAGATEITHVERDTVRDLERHLGMKHESALQGAKEWYS